MKKMMTRLMATAVMIGATMAQANALDLSEAKAKGLIGERLDGYLGAVESVPSTEVMKLITEVNDKRRAQFKEISAKRGQPIAVVEKLAAEKFLEKTEAGHYIMSPSGAWVKK